MNDLKKHHTFSDMLKLKPAKELIGIKRRLMHDLQKPSWMTNGKDWINERISRVNNEIHRRQND